MKVPVHFVTDGQKMRGQMTVFGQTTTNLNIQQVMLYGKLVDEEVGKELLGTPEIPGALPRFLESIGSQWGYNREAAIEVIDACGDGIVVLLGLLLSMGVDPDVVMERIWETNYAKAAEDGTLLRRADGKILKPPGWEPPQFGDLVDKMFTIGEQNGQHDSSSSN